MCIFCVFAYILNWDLICCTTLIRSPIRTAAGIPWIPRFDSMRGCCRMARRTWPRISMCVKGRVVGGLGGVSSSSSHIRRRFLPTLFTSLQESESQFLSNSNYSCFMMNRCSNSLMFMVLPPLCQECLSLTFGFYRQERMIPPVPA